VEIEGTRLYPAYNPAFGEVIAHAPETPKEEIETTVLLANDAQERWSRTPVTERVAHLFSLERLMRENADILARSIVTEHGKTLEEARGEVARSCENVQAACSAVYHMMGKNSQDISRGIDEELYRVPAGVFVAITPFNFPLMVPFWFLPYALAAGNSIIIKPSEKTPVTMTLVSELFAKAGIPEGAVSVLHGGAPVATALLEHPMVTGVSFVGSTVAAKRVYAMACESHKRVQAGASAKNFEVVMPDADIGGIMHSLLSSFFGNAGERCLAGSVLVTFAENHDRVVSAFTEGASKLRVGYGLDPQSDVGALIRREHLERVEGYVETGEIEGARLTLDGRKKKPTEYPRGFFLGPCVFDRVTRDMKIMQEEIFGPVACVTTVDSLDDAIELINSSRYGNAATIFTQSGSVARKFVNGVSAGNIGVNVGVAAPVAFYPFGGVRESFFGDLHPQGGEDYVHFYTDPKVVVFRW